MSEASIKHDDLPSTWALTNLGVVINYGSTNKAEPHEIADGDWILELEDIEKDSSRLLQKMTFLQRQSKSTKNHFQAGDVLYGKLRPYLNKVLIAGEPGYCTTEILPLRAGPHIDNRYLFYWFKHPAFLKYVEAESHGMNMPRLGTEAGKAAPFVLAPRNEQTRIANQLDTLLASIQACNDRFDAIPALLKRFRQTVLRAAINGSLSENWRKTFRLQKACEVAPKPPVPHIPESWLKTTFESLLADIDKLSYGVLKPDDPMGTGVTMFRVVDIGEWGKSANTVPNKISKSLAKQYLRTQIEKGDVLLSVMATIGRAMVADDSMLGSNVNRALAVVKPNHTKVDSYFLLYLLLSPQLVEVFEKKSLGSAQVRINLGDLRQFSIALPPLLEQTEIVRRVEALFVLADRIEAHYTAARTQAQRLTPLVLAKAFRGELVQQDPNDEPASALLARIASSNTAVAGENRRKTPVTPKERAQAAIY